MSLDARRSTAETRLRCENAVANGIRRLLPDEQTELRRRGARSIAAGCALLIPVPLLFLVFLCGLALVSEADGSLNAGALGVMALMLVSLPLMLLFGNQWLRRGIGLRRDAGQGEVLQFIPVAPPARGADPSPALAWFEVLPHTRLVWRTEAGLPPGWETVQVVEVAETPERAATAAQWTSPVDPVQAPGVEINHRELTAPERAELLRHLRNTAWAPLRSAVPLSLWAGGLLYGFSAAHRWPGGHDLASFLLLLLATTVADIIAVTGLLTAWRLRKDHQVGRVIIVRWSQASGPNAGPAGPAALSPPTEFLPHSRRPWTSAGNPVEWRLK